MSSPVNPRPHIRIPAAALCTIALLLIAACGFRPVYGDKARAPAVEATFNQVVIENIPERSGQILRNALLDRLYSTGRPPADARYVLQSTPLYETLTELDITKGANATRAQLRLDMQITLIDRQQDNAVILTRRLLSITSYNVLQSRFTTRVSEDAARNAAINDLAEQIERHLALHFNRAGQ